MKDAIVVVPTGFGVVERDPSSADLSVPVFPIGFVLPFSEDERLLVFFPTQEGVIEFAEMLLRQARAYVNKPPTPLGPAN